MKVLRYFFISSIVFILSWSSAVAQGSNCQNLGFELGDFTNWVGYNWVTSTDIPTRNTSPALVVLPTSRRQVIMTDTTAYDANTGNGLKKIPAGYRYSARLGDGFTNADASFRCWEQSLRYTMTIDSTNALLIFKFALVLQYAAKDHTAEMEPRFKLTIFDKNDNIIPDCSNYDVYATSGTVKGFQTYTSSSLKDPVKWRDWTTVGANLLKYIGQTITIEFMAADCKGQFHFGYAYFVAECHPLYITVKYCAGDNVATLAAPEGFESYSWKDSNDLVVGTSKTLSLTDPVEGAKYTCEMISATDCHVTLKSTIAKYVIKTDFSSSMIDCFSNTVQFTNASTTTHGMLAYNWDFGDGKSSAEVSPKYTFATSGMHDVTLSVSNPPSTCVDTLAKKIESFSPPLVGISGKSTYCPGQSIYLKAYGAHDYLWSNGSTADSVKVSSPGAFSLVGHSTTGCVSNPIYKTVIEEPDWQFLDQSDPAMCEGKRALLKVSGAIKYLWSTGAKTDTISTVFPGIFKVTGSNLRGCEKSYTFSVVEYPFPKVDFTISASSLDIRHNQLTCTIPAQTGVTYLWDMGDGSTETSSTVQHTYAISNAVLEYTITLKASSKYGCEKMASASIEVIPFIPNVFSPNADGINDVFMPQMQLQVLDRYGTLLYKGIDGWDGTYKGRQVDPDTYFYLIDYTDKNQKAQTKKGYITLVR